MSIVACSMSLAKFYQDHPGWPVDFVSANGQKIWLANQPVVAAVKWQAPKIKPKRDWKVRFHQSMDDRFIIEWK